MHVHSHFKTRITYGDGDKRITLAPGVNEIPDADAKAAGLEKNSLFSLHKKNGFLRVEAPAPAPVAPVPPKKTVWSQRKGETKKAYAARLEALRSFAGSVKALPEDQRTVILDAATDDEKAAFETEEPKA